MVYNKAWEVGYARDNSRGVRRYIAATDTRATLQGFLEANVPLRAIARASGLSDTAIGNLIQGRHTQVQAATAAKVASLTLADIYARATGTVPAIGAVRRIQALMAIGWRKADLQAAGIPTAQLVTRSRPHITAEGWHHVRQVYDRLCMTPGPSPTTRERATRRGYAPPLAWDEGSIDDPHATPQLGEPLAGSAGVDQVAVAQAIARVGHRGPDVALTGEEQIAAVRALTARGASTGDIAAAVGVSDRTIFRWRERFEIPVTQAPTGGTSAQCYSATNRDQLGRSEQHARAGGPSSVRSITFRPL